MFESSIVCYYLKSYPQASFSFIGETEHISHILSSIQYSWEILSIKTRYRNILIWYTFFQLLRRPQDAKVIYLALDPFYLYFLLILRRSIHIWFMHKYWRDLTHWYDRFLNFFALKFFIFIHKSVKIIVLWPWIYKAIQGDHLLTSNEKKQFHWILHPFFLPLPNLYSKKNNRKIKFGLIGRQVVPYKKINYQNVILVKNIIIDLGWEVVESHKTDFVTNKEYFSVLEESDYILFLAPSNSYHYRCSGVLIEAISYAKPIICLSNPMTDYLFNKFGNIGYKFSNIQELIQNIPEILYNHEHRYSGMQLIMGQVGLSINSYQNYSDIKID